MTGWGQAVVGGRIGSFNVKGGAVVLGGGTAEGIVRRR